MFTFIRIHLPQRRIAQRRVIDRIRATRQEQDPNPQQDCQHNPWQKELERLQHGLRSESDQARIKYSSDSKLYVPIPAPPPPPPLPQNKHLKQGTLTDLKIWWGKATLYHPPESSELQRFAPSKPQKRHRWMQF